jgi:hypothetical protein
MKYLKLFENFSSNEIEEHFKSNGWSISEIEELKEDGYFNSFKFKDSNSVYVYRNITVLDSDINEFEKTYFNNNIGEYWSLSDNTRAIWGDRGDGLDDRRVEYQCIGILEIENIDWESMRFAYEDFYPHFVEELEIRAKKPNDNIRIINCYKV